MIRTLFLALGVMALVSGTTSAQQYSNTPLTSASAPAYNYSAVWPTASQYNYIPPSTVYPPQTNYYPVTPANYIDLLPGYRLTTTWPFTRPGSTVPRYQ